MLPPSFSSSTFLPQLLICLIIQPNLSSQLSFNFDIEAQTGSSDGFSAFLRKMHQSVQNIFSHCSSTAVEQRSLEQIYQAALREEANGTLIVYSGGNARGQGNSTKTAFEQRFPGLRIEIVVDYSIYQGPRIDAQLANDSLIPDVVQLQTLQDFPRWKEQGHLMRYKPANWSKVYKEYKDPEGYYTANTVSMISTLVNSQSVPEAQWPRTARDFLREQFGRGRMVVVHPKMDDFVLFYFKAIVDIYGYDFLTQFAAQQPVYVCDANDQFVAVGISGAPTADVAVGAFTSFALGNGTIPQFAFPADNDPFGMYATYTAIFAGTEMPETAKLYVNWLLEKESPNNQGGNIWSVRTDMQPQEGYKPVWEYKNSNHTAFLEFMEDYEGRERFSKQVDLYLGVTNCSTEALIPDEIYPRTAF